MSETVTAIQPRTFRYLCAQGEAFETPELQALQRLRDSLDIAPLLIVPAAAEEHFYRLNNLAGQLEALFEDVDLSDPDEDDLEELAPEAQSLFKRHFLLDEFIDLFYAGLRVLPSRVSVRRDGEAGQSALRGRPALIALKNVWAAAWTFEALTARLPAPTLALNARPVIISPVGETASAEVTERVQAVIGRAQVWTSGGGVLRLKLEGSD